ncbi:MAG: NYN domain-containing protein [Candidatus Omnitrophota bacterium]
MSLQYVIDGYNIIHHPLFEKIAPRKDNSRASLVAFIWQSKLCGSKNNSVRIIFDGYAERESGSSGIKVVFSEDKQADELINEIVRESRSPKTLVVVSDDLQIRIFAKAHGVAVASAGEFLGRSEKLPAKDSAKDEEKLNYSQMHKVNQELRKLWLK